jgi:uncharacterized protein (TIGR00303 family)
VSPSVFQDIEAVDDSSTLQEMEELASSLMLNPVFVCVISYTSTCEIPGITVAGANPLLLKFTSPADAEFLYYGHCKCIDKIPITPDGKPTPAIITRAALKLSNIPFFVVEAGTKIKPSIPHISFNIPPGNDIQFGTGLNISDVKKAFEYGVILGSQLGRSNSAVIIGESIPGGTTTALGILTALGINAKNKISSSMPQNPHDLKNQTVSRGMKNANISFGDLRGEPLKAISALGDPMVPSVAGMVEGILKLSSHNTRVMLAGGTQMASVLAVLKLIDCPLERICIGTTAYVAEDKSSNLAHLVKSISTNVPIYKSNLHLAYSSFPGLRSYANGYVKEGVGAGGVSIAAMLKSGGHINGEMLLRAVEQEYYTISQIR